MPKLQPVHQMPYSLLISQEGTEYKARDGYGRVKYHGTDASTVIQAAIDALPNGGKIFLKAGTYNLASGLSITAPIIIIGEGMVPTGSPTVLQATSSMSSIIEVNMSTDSSFILQDLELDGNGQGCHGLTVLYAIHSVVENVMAKNCVRGFNLLGLAKSIVSNCRSYLNDYGIHFYNSGAIRCSEVTFFQCTSSTNNLYGLYASYNAQYSSDLAFLSCTIEANKQWGAYFNNVQRIAFHDCHFEANNTGKVAGSYDLKIAGTKMVKISRCLFQGTNVDMSLDVESAEEVSIDSCRSDDNCLFGGSLFDISSSLFSGNLGLNIANSVVKDSKVLGTTTTYSSVANLIFGSMYFTTVSFASGSSKKWINCYGYVTENSGTATILNGQTSVTFAHGLAATPTLVTLGAAHAEVSDAIWSADATNITITVPSAVSANRNISWYAEYKP